MRGSGSQRNRPIFAREVSESPNAIAILERDACDWNPVEHAHWIPHWDIYRRRFENIVQRLATPEPTPEPAPIRTVKKPFRLRAARRANLRTAVANTDKSLSTRARRYPQGRYQLRPRNA